MDELQKLFDAALAKVTREIQFDLVRKKFKEAGVSITDEQIKQVLGTESEGVFKLELEDEQLTPDSEAHTGQLKIDFADAEFEELLGRIPGAMDEFYRKTVPEVASIIEEQLIKDKKKTVRNIRSDAKGFAERLYTTWKEPLELFHLYLAVCNEAAADFNKVHRPAAAKNNDLVFDVLIRLQARGCQIALEILTLLLSGLADGAHARWRSLHEVVCVAMFVTQCGNAVANKYLLHDIVQSYKAASQYQVASAALRHKPIPAKEFSRLQQDYDAVKKQFGKRYCSDYGWAADELKKEKPTFADIEKAVGLEKLRPYYKMASHNVHAGSKAILFKLALPGRYDHLLAGSSDVGLADPGQGAAISLQQLTATLLTYKPNMDSLVMLAVLSDLQTKIADAFIAIERQ